MSNLSASELEFVAWAKRSLGYSSRECLDAIEECGSDYICSLKDAWEAFHAGWEAHSTHGYNN